MLENRYTYAGLIAGTAFLGLSLLARSSASPLPATFHIAASAGLFLISMMLLVFLAWEWFLALLLVGQPFLKVGLESLGGASRNDPTSPSLLLLGAVVGAYLITRGWRAWRSGDIRQQLETLASNRLLIAGVTSVGVLAALLFLRLPDSLWRDYGLRKALGFVLYSLVPFALVLLTLGASLKQRRFALALAVVGICNALLVATFLWSISGSPLGPGVLVKFTNQYFLGIPLEGGSWFARRTAVAGLSAVAIAVMVRGRLRFLAGLAGLLLAAVTSIIHGRAAYMALLTGAAIFGLLVALPRAGVLGRRRATALIGAWLVLPLTFAILATVASSGAARSDPAAGAGSAAGDPRAVSPVFEHSLVLKSETFAVKEWIGAQAGYRLTWYASAAGQFLERPLAGYGTGSWLPVHEAAHGAPIQPGTEYPHNIALEAAAELGLLGLLPPLVLLAVSIAAGARVWAVAGARRPLAAWALAVALMGWLNAMVSGDLYRNDFVWVGSALLLALDHSLRREGSRPLLRP